MSRSTLLLALLTTGLLGLGAAALPEPPAAPPKAMRGLIFSKTAGFRHDSIPDGIKALEEIAETTKETTCPMVFEASEDSTIFSAEQLARFDVVIFLSTTGDILNDEQQKAFESWYRNGRGFVGIHAAADTEHTWPWFGLLIGAYFKTHPPVQKATVVVEDRKHQSTAMLPERWERIDEWYVYNENPRTKKIAPVHVLANLDESTYDTGGHPMGDHPIAWCHEFDGGRSWYTGGGHTKESFSEPLFREHIRQGIAWSVKRRIEPVKAPAAPAPELAPTPGPAKTSTPADRK
jgi:type 1 glutamine amidotransferase